MERSERWRALTARRRTGTDEAAQHRAANNQSRNRDRLGSVRELSECALTFAPMNGTALLPRRTPPLPGHPRDRRPVPRWAEVVAHLVPLTTLPSGLWRIAIACGFSLGMLDHGEPIDVHGWESVYLVCLSLTIEGFALLAFGLVRPWGECVPRWFPVIAGRRVPPRLVVAAAATGTVLVTFVALMFFVPADSISDLEGTSAGRAVAVACYLPLLLWGPLLGALTIAYHRRRCRG